MNRALFSPTETAILISLVAQLEDDPDSTDPADMLIRRCRRILDQAERSA